MRRAERNLAYLLAHLAMGWHVDHVQTIAGSRMEAWAIAASCPIPKVAFEEEEERRILGFLNGTMIGFQRIVYRGGFALDAQGPDFQSTHIPLECPRKATIIWRSSTAPAPSIVSSVRTGTTEDLLRAMFLT